jgi:hypothetical protein
MRAQVTSSLFFAMIALCGLVACNRPLSQAELKSHFAGGGGPNWLFVSGGHIDFDARTAGLIKEWLNTHDTGCMPASLDDFSPAKTQLLTSCCAVEIDGDRIVISFERDPKDSDSTMYIQRQLSLDEQSFWNRVVDRIKTANNTLVLTRKSEALLLTAQRGR